MKHTLSLLTALLISAPLLAASLARTAQVASPAAATNARLLAQVEPRFKAIYETNEFAVRSFGVSRSSKGWRMLIARYLIEHLPAGPR